VGAMDYLNLGRSSLRVSRLALGTMTFGREGWGCSEDTARRILDRYLAAGGNLIDTADVYAFGTSEEIVGSYLADHRARHRVVLATKYSLGSAPGETASGGNGRRNMIRSVEGSLARL